MDARNKQHCQNIDERMHQLHNASSGLGRYPGIETYDNTYAIVSRSFVNPVVHSLSSCTMTLSVVIDVEFGF